MAVKHYYAIYTSGNGSSATDANVKAGTGTGYVTGGSDLSVTEGVEKTFTATGLSSDTQYDLEWVSTNSGGDVDGDTRGASVSFRTKRASGSITVLTPPPIVRK